MQRSVAKVLGGSFLIAAGAITYALGELAGAAQYDRDSAKTLGVMVIIVGAILGASGLRNRASE